MKVFLSWSGERSRQVADFLNDWLQCVVQAIEPWMSSKDIDRGSLWFSDITDQLAVTGIGIVCLTKENKNKPWILFEAGALAKGMSSNKVCTLLIDLKPSDVENPLAQFNHTDITRDSIWNLVSTINRELKDKALKPSILEQTFDTYWGRFDSEMKKIIKNTPVGEVEETRSENDIMIEVLSSIRSMDRRMRNLEGNKRVEKSKFIHFSSDKEQLDLAEKLANDLFKRGTSITEIEDMLSISSSLNPIEVDTILRKLSIGNLNESVQLKKNTGRKKRTKF